jgi:zona occludens toxin (predicted ATPase)
MITKTIEGGVNQMLFKSKKDESKKEFIQYKDGKIVSVEVDKPRKPQGVLDSEEIPLYQEMPEEKPKEKQIEKVKKWMTVKKLKVLIAIVVLIFFAYTVSDIYKAFFTESKTTKTTQVEQPSTTPKVQPPNQVRPSSKTSSSAPFASSAPVATTPTNTTPQKKTPTKTQSKKDDDNKKPTATSDSLKVSLETANMVNQVIVSQSSAEIAYINNYAQRKANKIGLENQLEKSLKEKQNAYFTLTTNGSTYKDSTGKSLYKTTKERILASVQFTKTAQQFMQEGRGKEALLTYANEYVATDKTLRENQVNALEEVLKQNKFSYKFNDVTGNIEFVLP